MKWVALIIVLAAILPLSGWLRRNPSEAPKIWMLMGFLPFVLDPLHLYMAVISWADWPGYVKGAEFSVLDALALAFYLSLPGPQHPLPFRFSMALYFFAALLSTLQAEFLMAALFYPWQLARMFLIYAVVTRACTDPRVAPALMRGLGAGLIMEAGIAIWQRFGLGIHQAYGSIDSQNLLGMLSHLIVFPFFALLLTRRRDWLPCAVVLAGIVVEVLTVSRATIGLAGFGYAAVFMFSALRQWTSRKALVLLFGAAILVGLTPLVLSSFEQRMQFNSESASDDERAAYIKGAELMFSDHPLGVGANHFSLVANLDGYYQMAGVAAVSSARYQNVHNAYWLVVCETGYLGLVTFVLFLLRPMVVAVLCGWRNRGDQRGDLLLGLGVGLLAVDIHSFFEWIFVDFKFQYIFALGIGLVAGLAQQLGYWRQSHQQGVRVGAGTFASRPAGELAVPSSVARGPTIVGPAGDRPA